MKKKKLKKEIKKLRKEIFFIEENQSVMLHDGREAFFNQRSRIDTLDEKYTKLREDLTDLEERRDTDLYTIEDAFHKADRNRIAIDNINKKLEILQLRTGTDYTQFKTIADTSKGPDAVRGEE